MGRNRVRNLSIRVRKRNQQTGAKKHREETDSEARSAEEKALDGKSKDEVIDIDE